MIRIVRAARWAALEEHLETESEGRAAAEKRVAELRIFGQRAEARIADLEDHVEDVSGDLGAAEHHIAGLEEEAAALRFDSETDLRAAAAHVGELEREVAAERQARTAAEERCAMYRRWLLHLLAHPDTRVPRGLEARMLLAMGDAEHAVMGQLMDYYAARTPAIAEGSES